MNWVRWQAPATLTASVTAGPDVRVRGHAEQYRAAEQASPRVKAPRPRFPCLHGRGAGECGERVKVGADGAVLFVLEQVASAAGFAAGAGAR